MPDFYNECMLKKLNRFRHMVILNLKLERFKRPKFWFVTSNCVTHICIDKSNTFFNGWSYISLLIYQVSIQLLKNLKLWTHLSKPHTHRHKTRHFRCLFIYCFLFFLRNKYIKDFQVVCIRPKYMYIYIWTKVIFALWEHQNER